MLLVRIQTISLLLSLWAQATVAEVPTEYVLCRNKKIVRTIRIEKQENGECATIYTKAGQDRDVGGGKWIESCEKIVENIKGNLEKAGWTCRVVPAAGITESN